MAITIGELVAILRLDPSDFTKGQRKLVKDAEKAAENIEQHFEDLGINSARHLDMVREKARRNYEAIAKHAESTFQDITRAHQAMMAQLGKINQLQFGKQITDAEKLAAAYKNLGLRSPADIEVRKKQLQADYDLAAKAAGNNATEILRLEQAKNKALEKLNQELYGKRISNEERMVAAAQASAARVTQAYKTLGITSSAQFDAMRQSANQAFATIAMDAKSNQADISKAWEARAAMMARIDEQQYGKQISKAQAAAQQMAEAYKTLGIRSSAEIEKQRQQIISSYDHIANAAKKGSKDAAADTVRAEKAKTAALKRLHEEQYASQNNVFARIKTGAAMVLGHAVTQFTLLAMAVHRILSTIGRAIVNTFKTGFQAMADYEIAVASLAAMVVTFTKKPAGKTQAEYWQDAVRYAEGMVPVLENIAAKTLMTGEQVTALANAFARVGVFLDPGNARQMESFTAIANALPILTRGQEIMKQINTEIRALTQGTNMATSMLLTTLHALDPMIKKHIVQWREQGTVLENIGQMLSGFIPASKLLEQQWQAIKNAMTTVWKQTLRGGMLGTYKEIIAVTQQLTQWAQRHREQLSSGLAVAWAAILQTVKFVWEVLKPFVSLAGLHLEQLLAIGKAYVYIITLLKQGVEVMGHLLEIVVSVYRTLWETAGLMKVIATGDWSNIPKQFDAIKNAAKNIGVEAKAAFDESRPRAWSAAIKEASNAMRTLEMNTTKAYQKIGEGALGVRDALSQAAEAMDFVLPSHIDFQIEEKTQLFAKTVVESEKLIKEASAKLKTLEQAWATGNRDAVDAVLRGMYENVTWTNAEIEDAYAAAVETLQWTVDTTTKDLEATRRAYVEAMKKLREDTNLGRAMKLLDYSSAIDKEEQKREIRAAYDIILAATKEETARAMSALAKISAAFQSYSAGVFEENTRTWRFKILAPEARAGMETNIKVLNDYIADLKRIQDEAPKRLQMALDKLSGTGGRGGKSQFQTDLENWKKTAEGLRKELRYLGVEGIEKELMEIEDRYQELRNMPQADTGFIEEWKSKRVAQAWIEEGKRLNESDPLLQKRQGMLEAEARAQEILGEMAEEARWKEIQALANAGDAYKEFRAVTTDEEKQRIAEMIYASKKWQDAHRLALDDYATQARRVGGQVYDAMTNALYSVEDTLVEFCTKGKTSFSDLANSIMEDIMRIYIRSQILGPIAKGIGEGDWITKAVGAIMGGGITDAASGGFLHVGAGGTTAIGMAKGGFLPNTTSYANTILTKPTFIPFAAGGVLAGEAGKEAVLPVSRMPSGNLGVEASGLGGGVEINIFEAPGVRARVAQQSPRSFDIFVEQIEGAILSRGERGVGMVSALDSRYRRNR